LHPRGNPRRDHHVRRFAWLLGFGGGLALIASRQRRGKDGFCTRADTGDANLAAGPIILRRPEESLHEVVDVLLGVFIIADLPESSFYLLGVMLAVSLLVDGLARMVLRAVAHRGLGRIAPHPSAGGPGRASPCLLKEPAQASR
jgi:hypothetical protein